MKIDKAAGAAEAAGLDWEEAGTCQVVQMPSGGAPILQLAGTSAAFTCPCLSLAASLASLQIQRAERTCGQFC